MKLYVGRLPYSTTNEELADLFGQVGQVISATVITDRETGRSRGFGFVEMSNDEESQNAINQLNNSTLQGRTIVVNQANDRPSPDRGYQGRERRGGGGGYRRY